MAVSSMLLEERSSEVAMRVFLFVTQRVPFSTKKRVPEKTELQLIIDENKEKLV